MVSLDSYKNLFCVVKFWIFRVLYIVRREQRKDFFFFFSIFLRNILDLLVAWTGVQVTVDFYGQG